MAYTPNSHLRNEIARLERRKLIKMFTGWAMMFAGPFGGRTATAFALTDRPSADEQAPSPWTATLGGADGPHPPFVSNSRRLLCAPELLDAPDEWIDRSLQWIDFVLRSYPPGLIEIPVRRAALFRLDEVLHIESAPRKVRVQAYYQMRLERAIAEIEQAKIDDGMRIWRLYNHGVIVRTPSSTFAFDVVPGAPVAGFSLSSPWLERLVAQCDALFISHKHPDHADARVASLFMRAGKPVVTPERLFPENAALAEYLTVPERSLDLVHPIAIQKGKRTLQVVTYPGHQREVQNNVTLITAPEAFTVVHTGDQLGEEGKNSDFDWLAHIGHYHRVDLLLTNGWANDLHRTVRGINPQLVMPGHQNEMGHVVSHREEYTQDYERMFGLHFPYIVMSWGESYMYKTAAESLGEVPDEN